MCVRERVLGVSKIVSKRKKFFQPHIVRSPSNETENGLEQEDLVRGFHPQSSLCLVNHHWTHAVADAIVAERPKDGALHHAQSAGANDEDIHSLHLRQLHNLLLVSALEERLDIIKLRSRSRSRSKGHSRMPSPLFASSLISISYLSHPLISLLLGVG